MRLFRSYIEQVSDHIMFTRPLLLMPIWTPALLGFWAGGGEAAFAKFMDVLTLTTGLGIFVYGLNQLNDIESDRINKKNTVLSLGLISKTMAVIITVAGMFAAFIVGAFSGIITTFLTAVGVLLGISYSLPPLRFKDRPIHSLTFNALGHGSLVFLIGWSIGGKWTLWAIPKALAYALAYSGVYCFTTVPDADGDKRTNKITVTVRYGAQKTMAVGLILIFFAGFFGFIVAEPALFMTAIISLPFYVLAVHNPERCVRANQVAVLSLSVLACFYMLPYMVVILVTIVFSALYYRKRLGVRYP